MRKSPEIDRHEFDVSYWEKTWESVKIPVERKKEEIHELHRLFERYLPHGNRTFLEVGCAPGSFLVYFRKTFGYSVSGIEYAKYAHEKTVENLKLQNTPAEIFHRSFFDFEHSPYDIVFSAGFIEHFLDVRKVIQRLAKLCSSEDGFVVTSIPIMSGINWWISRTFRPDVAAGHFPIARDELIKYHEEAGLTTCYCNYFGSFKFIKPVALNKFAHRHPMLSAVVNAPFQIWNRIISSLTKRTGLYPKWSVLTSGIVYIGRKGPS